MNSTRYNNKLRWFGIITAVVVMMATGCAEKPDGPPEVVIDKVSCARCSMLISDTRFIAAVKSGEEYLVFDDIGCMLTYIGMNQGVVGQPVWVRDYTMDKWISAKQAQFFHVDGDITPMGYGYIAVTSSKPPVGVLNARSIGGLEQLRTDHASRMKTL